MFLNCFFTDKIFDISAFIISAQFWPTFNKESLELPEEIGNEFEKYTKAYEAYKGNRTLNWRTVTGRVNIVIEIGQRTIEMTVAPTHAIMLYHFQDKGEFRTYSIFVLFIDNLLLYKKKKMKSLKIIWVLVILKPYLEHLFLKE